MVDKVIITGTTDDEREFSVYKVSDTEDFCLKWKNEKSTRTLTRVEKGLIKEIVKLVDGDGKYSLKMFSKLRKKD